MRLVVRILTLGSAAALVAFPLAQGVGNAQAAAATVPATVTAAQWTAPTVQTSEIHQYSNDVSCATSTFCLAVGGSYTNENYEQRWNGSKWSDGTMAPNPLYTANRSPALVMVT